MEQIDFFQMMKQQQEEKEVKEEPKPQKVEKPKNEEPKEKPKEKAKPTKKEAKKDKESTYTYPFSIYSEGRIVDISSYGFIDGKEYKEDEITKIMLEHRHYEFAGKMEYNFIKVDNVLVVNGVQHRKG